MNSGPRRLVLTVALATLALAACTAGNPRALQSHTPSPSASPAATIIERAHGPASQLPEAPDSESPAAGVCPLLTGNVVTFVIAVDTPQPRCGKVNASQRLRAVNHTATDVTFTFAGDSFKVPSGSARTVGETFGQAWQPGVHDLETSLYSGSGPEIWLVSIAIPPGTPSCTAGQLRLLDGDPISEGTGQHTRTYALKNTSAAACTLRGYPSVSLLNASGHVIPFVYRDGGDQMLTAAKPRLVGLPEGGFAYFAINKYRCDVGDKDSAQTIRVVPPGDNSSLALPHPALGYCGPGDPGSVVDISPVEINSIAYLSGV
jgi:hypothetical protein